MFAAFLTFNSWSRKAIFSMYAKLQSISGSGPLAWNLIQSVNFCISFACSKIFHFYALNSPNSFINFLSRSVMTRDFLKNFLWVLLLWSCTTSEELFLLGGRTIENGAKLKTTECKLSESYENYFLQSIAYAQLKYHCCNERIIFRKNSKYSCIYMFPPILLCKYRIDNEINKTRGMDNIFHKVRKQWRGFAETSVMRCSQ